MALAQSDFTKSARPPLLDNGTVFSGGESDFGGLGTLDFNPPGEAQILRQITRKVDHLLNSQNYRDAFDLLSDALDSHPGAPVLEQARQRFIQTVQELDTWNPARILGRRLAFGMAAAGIAAPEPELQPAPAPGLSGPAYTG